MAVTINIPVNGVTVQGTVNVTHGIIPPSGRTINGVVYIVDGSTKLVDTSSPYQYAWDTTQVINGTHQLKVRVVYDDISTEEATSLVTVANPQAAQTVNVATVQNPVPIEYDPTNLVGMASFIVFTILTLWVVWLLRFRKPL